jgi:serine phosphatase RsbU (regulator of sigma subunit)
MMLVTLWIRLSGQWELFPFYFLVVVVAAMWFKVLGGALAATFCNFFFLFLWSRAAADPELEHIPVFTTSMALGTLLLFLVGCLVGYIAEIQDKERERRLESQLLVANYQREIDLSSQLQPLLFESQNQNAQSPGAQNLDIGVATKAARELGGGDYVDAIALGEDKTLICIADVSGKSVRAQARLPLLKYALRALAPLHHDPADLVKNLNETLAPDLQPELYIAFCCAVIDGKLGVLRWCNAGHIAPLVVRNSLQGNNNEGDILIQPLETCGPPLGLFPEREYSGCEIKWHEGDQLLLYTDGLSDALSFNNTEDGEAQVRRLAARLSQETQRPIDEVADDFIALAGAALEAADELPERLRAGFISSLKNLRAPATPSNAEGAGHRDDITVVVVRAKSAA